jgi:hypothetical protein
MTVHREIKHHTLKPGIVVALHFILFCCFVFISSCSKSSPTSPISYTFLQPLSIGNSWDYLVIQSQHDSLNSLHYDTSFQKVRVIDTLRIGSILCFALSNTDSSNSMVWVSTYYNYFDSLGNFCQFGDSSVSSLKRSELIMPSHPVSDYKWSRIDSIQRTNQRGEIIPDSFIIIHKTMTLSGPATISTPSDAYNETWMVQMATGDSIYAPMVSYYKSGIGLVMQTIKDLGISKVLTKYTLK